MRAKRIFTHIKGKSVFVFILAIATLGSGFINLFSLIGPGLPDRLKILQKVFPIEFVHLSRFLTLIVGFTLIVSSINIYKRKKRAFQIVLVLLSMSVISQLTKGLDYEEALLSLVLIVLLLSVRASFTVKSSIPNLGWGVIRFLLAVLVAFTYGVIGFWLLDRREFGINFTFADSIHRMLLFISLAGDSELVPRTPYARWFLDSLSVISITAIVYSVFSVFRPVIYTYRTLPRERYLAKEIVEKYGRDSQDYFKVWPDKTFYFSPSQNCFIAYRVGAGFAVALADPVGPEGEIEETIKNFHEFCRENDWRLAFHQVLPDFIPIYTRLGFRKLKIGDDAIVDLTTFSLEGKAMKELRHTVNKMEKTGIHIEEFEPPVDDNTISRLREVSDDWLKIPGRRERGFTLGRFDPVYLKSTTIYAAVDKDHNVLAFVNIIPSYHEGETTVDLMRRRRDAPNGIMDYLILKIISYSGDKKFQRFNIGMAPMSGLQEKDEASIEEKAIYYFSQHMNFIFSFAGLKQHKEKFASHWEPRYTIYRNTLDLPLLALAISKLTELQGQKVELE